MAASRALLPSPQVSPASARVRLAAAVPSSLTLAARGGAGAGARLRVRCAILSSPAPVAPTESRPVRRISPSAPDGALRPKPAVLVAEKLSEAGLAVLRQFADVECAYGMSPAELLAKAAQFDALIVRSGTKVTREVLEAGQGRLRVVGRAGVGIDNVDLQAATEAIARADFISLHMPLIPTTSKIFNDESFAKMKTGVRIINVARGGVIDEDALVRALDSGKVAQAALDVFTVEPPPKDSKLVLHENVTVTPHLGASTVEAQEGVAIEIAEAVVGALRGELAATAVNAPMVPAEILSELAPYVSLAEKLGRLAVQLVAGESGIKGVKVVYTTARGPDDLDTRLLRAMVTKGLVEPVSSTFVNLVNADYTAKQRGLRLTEERVAHDSPAAEAPLESVQVRLSHVQSKFAGAISDGGDDIVLEGRVKYGVPHLTLVGPYEVDVSLEGNLILCRQIDQPGMIGKVGNILGDTNVNINFMSVGRTFRGKQAIMAIGVDEEPDKDTLEKIGAIPAIEEFVFLEL
uniref:phosphoglycerate dehydrogenase n=1 Tax=Zea mays TaxID=4577 RepID=C0PKN2_MAIZE|nr:unknown [Zea mays]|eukprot:XP_008673578.1 uncharacterized protein LOC100280688 isoform X2 [Zea mays]